MAVYEYRAIDSNGKQVKGVIDAENIRAARSALKKQSVFPTTLTESRVEETPGTKLKVSLGGGKVSIQQLSVATRQLSTLVAAGIPLVQSIRALSEQLDNPELRRIYSEVRDRVNEGSTLADAMKEYPKVFPRLYVNMIASGEISGSLDLVLERLADLLESQAELKRKVIAASAYPILMLVVCLLVILILLAYVIPEITAIFQERDAALPLATQIVIALSDMVQEYWFVALGAIFFLLIAFQRYKNTEKGRWKVDTLKLRVPLIGPTTRKIATARFARTLGTMLASGVELLRALSIVKNIVGNVVLEEAIEKSIEGVREGRSLAKELERSEMFPRLLIHMVAIGEKTGQLEPMLLRAATNYESEVDALISGLTKILEPALILFIAVVVGSILASVMLPMLEMSSLSA